MTYMKQDGKLFQEVTQEKIREEIADLECKIEYLIEFLEVPPAPIEQADPEEDKEKEVKESEEEVRF